MNNFQDPKLLSLRVPPGRNAKLQRPGLGLLVAAIFLGSVEFWLHTDGFLHHYRSVFAAGRALDKTIFVETHCPELLILGNSRADNGFDPNTVRDKLDFPLRQGAFNLGTPGADTRVLAGILDRLDRAGCLQPRGVRYAVLSLDEALVQSIDTLGQEVFFASVRHMLADAQYHDAFRATLRLYGFSTNLRQLREPASLLRFIEATRTSVDPVGGGAALHQGYRQGIGGLQDSQSALRQERGSQAPPDAANVRHLWRMLDLLATRGVRVAVVFPPLLNREVLYQTEAAVGGAPYQEIAAELRRRGVPMISLDAGPPRNPAEFVNAGHMNDLGAQRYSALLARALNKVWSASSRAVSSRGAMRFDAS